jgi:hydrogenase maturation protease
VKSTLIIGYGNPDRQDDGAAWYILNELASRFGCADIPSTDEGLEPSDCSPSFIFSLQLMPELAETIARYERACFVDAHTENIAEPIQFTPLNSAFQRSPLTHHMTPQTTLSIAETLYGRAPQAMLCSVRGYEFGFDSRLSAATQALADQAVQKILSWVNDQDS